MLNYLKTLNLTHKITASIALMIMIFCLVTSYQFKSSTNSIKDTRIRNIETYVNQLNKSISALFFERYGDVQAFAKNNVFIEKNKTHMSNVLNDYANLYGIYNLILFINTDGQLISVNNKKPDNSPLNVSKIYNLNFKNESWFIDALNEKYSQDVNKGFNGTVFIPFIEDTLVSEIYGEKIQTSIFAAPVKDRSGQIIGVICNRAHSKWFTDELSHLKDELTKEHWSYAYLNITNEHNLEIAHQVIGKDNSFRINHEKAVITKTIPINEAKFLNQTQWKSRLSVPEEVLYQDVIKSEQQFFSALFILFALSMMASFWIAKQISSELTKISKTIAEMSDFTNQLTLEFSKSSENLSTNSIEQVSAIHQSVAALTEMTSRIEATSSKVHISSEISKSVQTQAHFGCQIMEKVTQNMNEINSTNFELQEIKKMMSIISQKTELINDIVFKTQLLSFNASIEAARAGQNGRGFSVVADEVSHLAELSGKASKEIESLIKEGQRQVEKSLINIQTKITDGSQVTSEANRTFNEINNNINLIAEQLNAVNQATDLQNRGIQQANSSMKQLESSADFNSLTAKEFTQRFEELKDKTVSLNRATMNLKRIVNG